MKKVIYSLTLAVLTLGFVACSNDDHDDFGVSYEKNIEARASALGFEDVASYEANVAEKCAAGNHENCEILADGTHEACGYAEHAGTRHDGNHHNGNGSEHGSHNGTHDNGKHH